jgi:hypothetical protein
VGKTALIVIDGVDSTRKMAETIAGALSPMETMIMPADEFDVTKLLAASACFFGVESPNPPCFSFISEVLAHINLAARPSGVFSPSKEAAAYLIGIIHDAETALCQEPFLGEGDIKAWTKKVCTKGQKK